MEACKLNLNPLNNPLFLVVNPHSLTCYGLPHQKGPVLDNLLGFFHKKEGKTTATTKPTYF